MWKMKPKTASKVKKVLLKIAFYFGLLSGVVSGKSLPLESASQVYISLFPDELLSSVDLSVKAVATTA